MTCIDLYHQCSGSRIFHSRARSSTCRENKGVSKYGSKNSSVIVDDLYLTEGFTRPVVMRLEGYQ